MEEILERLKAIELDNKIIKGLLSAQLDALAKLKKPAKTPKIKVERVHKQTRAKLCAPHTAQIELDPNGRFFRELCKYDGKKLWGDENFIGRQYKVTIQEFEKKRGSLTPPQPRHFGLLFLLARGTPMGL